MVLFSLHLCSWEEFKNLTTVEDPDSSIKKTWEDFYCFVKDQCPLLTVVPSLPDMKAVFEKEFVEECNAENPDKESYLTGSFPTILYWEDGKVIKHEFFAIRCMELIGIRR